MVGKATALLLLVLLTAQTAAAAGTCAGSSRGPLPQFIPFCRWYAQGACCTTLAQVQDAEADLAAIELHYATGNDTCGSSSRECASAIGLVSCGVRCSPDQGSFVSDDYATATICPTLAGRVYAACAEFRELDGGSCRRIADMYTTAKAFAEQRLGLKVATADTTSCFSSAYNTKHSTAVLAALVGVIALLLR